MSLPTTEIVLSFAQEISRNKHATSHANAAHARLLETAIKNQPVAFAMFPVADNFSDGAEYIKALASALDTVAHNLASEANANSSTHISTKDRISIFSDALADSGLLADLSEAEERLREDVLEAAE